MSTEPFDHIPKARIPESTILILKENPQIDIRRQKAIDEMKLVDADESALRATASQWNQHCAELKQLVQRASAFQNEITVLKRRIPEEEALLLGGGGLLGGAHSITLHAVQIANWKNCIPIIENDLAILEAALKEMGAKMRAFHAANKLPPDLLKGCPQ